MHNLFRSSYNNAIKAHLHGNRVTIIGQVRYKNVSQTYELKYAKSFKDKSVGTLYAENDPIAEAVLDKQTKEFTC